MGLVTPRMTEPINPDPARQATGPDDLHLPVALEIMTDSDDVFATAIDQAAPATLASRLAKPRTILSFVLAIIITIWFLSRLDIDPADIWRNIRESNPWYLLLALVAFYAAFLLRAWRWQVMLGSAGVGTMEGTHMPPFRDIASIQMISWFVNCVVPAKLGEAYRCYLLKQDTGTPIAIGFGTVLAERLLDMAVLFPMMGVAALVTFHGHIPTEASQALVFGIGILGAALIGGVVLWLTRGRISDRLPERFKAQFQKLYSSIYSSFRRPGLLLGVGVVAWVLEGLRVLFVAKALGVEMGIATAIFVAMLSAGLTALPITPAGIGVVEVAIISVLKLVDIPPELGGSIAILDRVVSYWSVLLIGTVVYLLRFRKLATANQHGETAWVADS